MTEFPSCVAILHQELEGAFHFQHQENGRQ